MNESKKMGGAFTFTCIINKDYNSNESIKRNISLVDGIVRIIEITSYYELKQFIQFPHDLYKDNLGWHGQDDEEILGYFDVEANPYLDYMKIQPFIAIRDGQVVGRICANINEHFNKHWEEEVGFFGFFECINDQTVANELLYAAENWVKNHNKTGMYGIAPLI